MLKKLLNDIVAENILHQLYGIRLKLLENLVLLIAVGGLQFRLDKARSMLVTTELNYIVVNVLNVEVSQHIFSRPGTYVMARVTRDPTLSSYFFADFEVARNSSNRRLRPPLMGS